MDLAKDIVFIGATPEKGNVDAINHVLAENGIVFSNSICQPDLVDQLNIAIRQ